MGSVTAVLLGALGATGAVLSAIIARQGADEFKAWTPRLTSRILELAVAKLPESKRDRMREEWAGRIEDTPGEVGKWVEAFRHLFASLSISRSNAGSQEKRPQAVPPVREPTRVWLTHPDADHFLLKSMGDTGVDLVFTTNHGTVFVQVKDFSPEGFIRLPHHGRR